MPPPHTSARQQFDQVRQAVGGGQLTAAQRLQANQILRDDAPWIFMNYTNQVRVTRANVKGFQLNPLQMFFNMEQVSLQ